MGDKLTIEETMKVLGVSRPTIYNLVRRGKLTKHISAVGGIGGRRTYFLRSEVEALRHDTVRLDTPRRPKK